MLTEQELRDELFVAILQRMYQDETNGEFNYGFDDIPSANGYHAVQYYVYHMKNDTQTMLGIGVMVTDTNMSHVLTATYFPFQCLSIFFPQYAP